MSMGTSWPVYPVDLSSWSPQERSIGEARSEKEALMLLGRHFGCGSVGFRWNVEFKHKPIKRTGQWAWFPVFGQPRKR
jgi:hypothetical protein